MKKFLVSEHVSSRLWALAFILIALGAFFLFVALTKNMNFLPGVLFTALGLGLIRIGYPVNVPTDPPNIALLTYYGERQPIILASGDHLLPSVWPFELGKIDIPIERVNYEFEFDATCKSTPDPENPNSRVGGKVIVKIELTIEPDYHAEGKDREDLGPQRMFEFLKSGRMPGVKSILEGMIKEAVRDTALGYTWEEFIFLKLPLSAQLVTMVADTRVAKLPRDEKNKVLSVERLAHELDITPENYDSKPGLERIEDALEYYAEAATNASDAERKAAMREVEKEFQFFLQVAVASGVGDVRGLGVKITRLNIARITGDPAMTEAANKAAAEDQERIAENKDGATELELAMKLVEQAKASGIPMSLDTAINHVQVRRGLAKKAVVISSGNPVLDAAAWFKS